MSDADAPEDVEKVIARAQTAWDAGRHAEAGRILEEYLREHPDQAEALRGRGHPGGDVEFPSPPPPPRGPLDCLRCRAPLAYGGRLRFHEGRNLAPFFLGAFGELLVNKVELDVHACMACGHVEMLLPDPARGVVSQP